MPNFILNKSKRVQRKVLKLVSNKLPINTEKRPTNEAIDLENICLLITEKIILFVPKNHMSF